jgi:catechol-2,3-dioxygenase
VSINRECATGGPYPEPRQSSPDGILKEAHELEVVVIPVSDVDRAKKFYHEALGFRVDVDHRAAVYKGQVILLVDGRIQ